MRFVASTSHSTLRSPSPGNAGARLRSDKGQSLIEFALVALAMVAMLLGVIDVGRFAYIGILVGNAARAGAAYGAANPGDDADIANAVCNDFLGNIASPANLGAVPAPTCDDTTGKTSGNPNGTNHLEVTYPSTQSDYVSCGCDKAGAYTTTYSGAACDDVTQAYIASNCSASGDHWAAQVTVQASGSFKALFLPTSVTFSQTATVRVP